jgi:hypothetical protein
LFDGSDEIVERLVGQVRNECEEPGGENDLIPFFPGADPRERFADVRAEPGREMCVVRLKEPEEVWIAHEGIDKTNGFDDNGGTNFPCPA